MAEVFAKDTPTGSALTQMRELVSWNFFRDVFQQSAHAFCKKLRPSWKGFYITAVDGDQYGLPRNDDTVAAGYKGQSCGLNLETYGLKMYVALGCDVITGVPLALVPSKTANELACGMDVTREISAIKNGKDRRNASVDSQLFIYDRLYLCYELLEMHRELGTSFIARCKRCGTFLEVTAFWNSDETDTLCEIGTYKIRLVKTIHNDETVVYATNVSSERLSATEIDWLYFRRWEVETTNAHGAKTIVLESFHTRKTNGILQEIFAAFWSLLIAKCVCGDFKRQSQEFGEKMYHRPNLKRVRTFVMKNIVQIFSRLTQRLCDAISEIVESTTRKRERLSRSEPRLRKYKRLKKYETARPVPKG